MAKHAAGQMLALDLNRKSPTPLYRQLYTGIRGVILAGKLRPGARLPSMRSLAADLALSRNTVVAAVSQLRAEGYVASRVGAGTRVAKTVPDDRKIVTATRSTRPVTSVVRPPVLSARARRFMHAFVSGNPGDFRPFRPGVPALDQFPIDLWSRLTSRYWRGAAPEALSLVDPLGYLPLREAIADYLALTRGVQCTADQVVITCGSQEGLYLSAQLLLNAGDNVWLEDPCYLGARGAALAAGARVVPVPLDEEGLRLTAAERREAPRLICVSPSYQYPLGITMSLQRRLALLRYAAEHRSWILEDDFDSEYRYVGRPLAALKALDTQECVIYLGTFSKVLFPALRIGYLVLPPALVDVFHAARVVMNRHSQAAAQAVLAAFIAEGHFERHVRRMKALYRDRQALFVEAARRELAGLLDVSGSDAGMHLVGWLSQGSSDVAAARAAAAQGVEVTPLSMLALKPLPHPGLLLGYCAYREHEIRAGVRALAKGLSSLELSPASPGLAQGRLRR